jgi:hypothetical protein
LDTEGILNGENEVGCRFSEAPDYAVDGKIGLTGAFGFVGRIRANSKHGETMRIFVSSSFEDLREHRAAAIHILRQLGHEVLAMEDLVAASITPLAKVLDMVDRSDAYVGIFAWRYGCVPGTGTDPKPPVPADIPSVEKAEYGITSITHYEYFRAAQRKLPIMGFLHDERYPWPPQLVDGFVTGRTQVPDNADEIRSLRQTLQLERIVSYRGLPLRRTWKRASVLP